MNHPTVLVICAHPEHASGLKSHWERHKNVPVFTVTHPDVCSGITPEEFDVAIVAPVSELDLAGLLDVLRAMAKPVIVVGGAASENLRQKHARAIFIEENENWCEVAVLLAGEMLRCDEALKRAMRTEQALAVVQVKATLGKYMVEMRHTLNNALTSVLGNSELLLLEPGCLPASARSQVETIRNMAMRMHEILQRFTSIEKELSVADRQAQTHSNLNSATAGH